MPREGNIQQSRQRPPPQAAAAITQAQKVGPQGELAQTIDRSPPVALQRAIGEGISGSPSMTAQRRHLESLSVARTPVRQRMPEEGKEIPESEEEDIENRAPEVVEEDGEGADLEADEQEDGELEDAGEEAFDEEEASESTAIADEVSQPKIAQLVKYKRTSHRIATYRQQAERRKRGVRKGRHRPVIRFVPGAAPQTALVPGIAALGGGIGLRCPLGTYVQRHNNFNYTGSRAGDAAALGGTPAGFVWHHCHDFVSTGVNAGNGTMMLMRIANHKPGHRGGVWQWNHTAANTWAYG